MPESVYYGTVDVDLCQHLSLGRLLGDLQMHIEEDGTDTDVMRLPADPDASEAGVTEAWVYCSVRMRATDTHYAQLAALVSTFGSTRQAGVCYESYREQLAEPSSEAATRLRYGVVEGIGEEAEASAELSDTYSGLQSLTYTLTGRDRNLCMHITVWVTDERRWSADAVAELVPPVARGILAAAPVKT